MTRCLCLVFIAVGLLGASRFTHPHSGRTSWLSWLKAETSWATTSRHVAARKTRYIPPESTIR
ncbi:hypothetical protein I79_013711 [Cricetulus griseus]|uniref:Secreted protein n=1 Tax=Cricetulus griseus TaxID=10029 RepID=G3HS84_CRIGR|nr:hypothetical protein I79_013711 [Cricetulus griseus]